MSDELAFRCFGVDAIMKIFDDETRWGLGVYWFLHFPLNLSMVKIDTKGLHLLQILCLYTWIKVYEYVKDLGKQED